MASSSDITEIKRFLISNGLCTNCSVTQEQQCVALYQLLNSKFKCGTLSSNDMSEMKRLILSNMSCMICMNSES
jgi:hypothetical protein